MAALSQSRASLYQEEGVSKLRYPLIQEAIIEGIPQYKRDNSGWVENLHDQDSAKDIKEKMKEIVDTLSIPFGVGSYIHTKENLWKHM